MEIMTTSKTEFFKTLAEYYENSPGDSFSKHSTPQNCVDSFSDDFGDVFIPCNLNHKSFLARYYFWRGTP